jgi:polyhydroxyalkanoate synthesis regulator phasin
VRTAVGGVSTAYQLLGEGMRTASRGQQAGSTLAIETISQSQRFWWDQWRRMIEVGLAVFFPVTSRQLDERFEAAARQVAERQRELRADLDRVAAELREAQREASQTHASAIREARGEQRDGRTVLEEALGQLDGHINQLAGAQGKQLDDITAALNEQEGRLRDRLGDEIRSAIESFKAAKPDDLEELRGQVSALTETVTALRNELVSLTRDGRQSSIGSTYRPDRPF